VQSLLLCSMFEIIYDLPEIFSANMSPFFIESLEDGVRVRQIFLHLCSSIEDRTAQKKKEKSTQQNSGHKIKQTSPLPSTELSGASCPGIAGTGSTRC
jgi:hypothetical protein